MAEVDIVSGMPKEASENKVSKERTDKLNERRTTADQLQESLSSETGQAVLNKIQEHLINRINKMVEDDAECRVLKRLLTDMGLTLNLGEKAAEGLMRLVVKRK